MPRDTMEVMLIDDHPLVNYGLAACLEETGRFKVSAQAVSLAQAKSFLENCGERAGDKKMPSIIILDIMLGEENGLDFLPFLDEISKARKIKKPPVLVCSVLEDPFLLRSAVNMGIRGYVSKTGEKTELLNAIDTIIGGETYFSNEQKKILEGSGELSKKFSKRETQVLNLVKQNRTNQQIAKIMNLSLRTIENHISNIYFKTGLNTRDGLLKL